MLARQLADRVVVAGIGQDDADVGEGRLERARRRRRRAASSRSRASRSLICDDARGLGRRHGRAEVAAPGDDAAIGREPGERLVDRAVVVVVVDEDLRTGP